MTDTIGFDIAVGLALVLAFALVRRCFGHDRETSTAV
jgi:hypothetical protein